MEWCVEIYPWRDSVGNLHWSTPSGEHVIRIDEAVMCSEPTAQTAEE